jgi:hypothetical protein
MENEWILNYGGLLQCYTFYTCILKVLASNLGRGTNYPDSDVVSLSPYRQIPEKWLKLGHDHFLPHPIQFIIH